MTVTSLLPKAAAAVVDLECNPNAAAAWAEDSFDHIPPEVVTLCSAVESLGAAPVAGVHSAGW